MLYCKEEELLCSSLTSFGGEGLGVAIIKLINQPNQTYYTRDGGRYE